MFVFQDGKNILKEYQQSRNRFIEEFYKENKILPKDLQDIINEIFNNFQVIEENLDFNSTLFYNNELNIKCLYENCNKNDFETKMFKVVTIKMTLLTLVIILCFLILFFTNEFWYKKYLKLFN